MQNLEIILNPYIYCLLSLLFCPRLQAKQQLWVSFSQLISGDWWLLCTHKDVLNKCPWENGSLTFLLKVSKRLWPLTNTGSLLSFTELYIYIVPGYFRCSLLSLSCSTWDPVPWPRIDPGLQLWKHGILATGPPWNSSTDLSLLPNLVLYYTSLFVPYPPLSLEGFLVSPGT